MVRYYHFLSRAFGEGVTIAKVVDFDVSNKVTVLRVDVGVQATGGSTGGLRSSGRGALGLVMASQRMFAYGQRSACEDVQRGLEAHQRAECPCEPGFGH